MSMLSQAWRIGHWAMAAMALVPGAQAHLMVAQRGTLNLVGNGAYLVLSVPVSAFKGVDDDGDGKLSVDELRAHGQALEKQLMAGVQLLNDAGPLPLEGLMLNLSPPDDAPGAPADQLVVTGRFSLPEGSPALRLKLSLFGATADERRFEFTVTRKAPSGLSGPSTPSHGASQHLSFEPTSNQHAVLPSAWQKFSQRVGAGWSRLLAFSAR